MDINNLIKKTNLYTEQNQESDAIVKVAILAQEILDKIAEKIQPGISESKATEAANSIFKDYGIEKLWHRPIIRFNNHTVFTFKDRPTENYILQEEDIAFIDIGIVKEGIEGDVGKTLVFGNNKEFIHLKNVSEILFQEATDYWQKENPTGIKLYDFIDAQAKNHQVLFNLSPAGHLIGAFPHTHAWTKGANTYPEKLVARGWILEIQIKSVTQPFGAFFEGLLDA
jgi:methionine aminopeptidase